MKLFFWVVLLISNILTAETFDVFHDYDRLLFWNKQKFLGKDEKDYELFKKVYLEKIDACLYESNQPVKIPKVFHFIWLGPKPFPPQSIQKLYTWKMFHPDWTFKFWTDSLQKSVPMPGMETHLVTEVLMENQKLYFLSDNYGEKADLLRYEILFQQGGIYVDHDISCYQSFEPLNRAYDFFSFMEPPHLNFGVEVLFFPSNGLIGSIAGHPILSKTMDYVRKRWFEAEQYYGTKTEARKRICVMFRTFHSFYLGVKDHLDDVNYENILFPPACGTSLIHGENIDYSVLMCDHSYDGTWLKDVPTKAKRKKKH